MAASARFLKESVAGSSTFQPVVMEVSSAVNAEELSSVVTPSGDNDDDGKQEESLLLGVPTSLPGPDTRTRTPSRALLTGRIHHPRPVKAPRNYIPRTTRDSLFSGSQQTYLRYPRRHPGFSATGTNQNAKPCETEAQLTSSRFSRSQELSSGLYVFADGMESSAANKSPLVRLRMRPVCPGWSLFDEQVSGSADQEEDYPFWSKESMWVDPAETRPSTASYWRHDQRMLPGRQGMSCSSSSHTNGVPGTPGGHSQSSNIDHSYAGTPSSAIYE